VTSRKWVIYSILSVAAGFVAFAFVAFQRVTARSEAILTSRTVVLTEKAVEYASPSVMQVVGPLSSVCFVLKNGVPLQALSVMNRIFDEAVRGARIDVTVIL
jgi:hypothetical protein